MLIFKKLILLTLFSSLCLTNQADAKCTTYDKANLVSTKKVVRDVKLGETFEITLPKDSEYLSEFKIDDIYGESYFIVHPDVLNDTISKNKLQNCARVSINTSKLIGAKRNKDGEFEYKQVFKVPGHYRLLFAENLETELWNTSFFEVFVIVKPDNSNISD